MSPYRDFRGNRPWPLEGEGQGCFSGSSPKVYSEKKIVIILLLYFPSSKVNLSDTLGPAHY